MRRLMCKRRYTVPPLCYAMKFNGKGKTAWTKVSTPTIQAETDVICRMKKTTICGTDLHIKRGAVPTCVPGTTLGHEGIGVVVERGKDVRTFAEGDQALITCVSGCGKCKSCSEEFYAHCTNGGGWNLGNRINGCQAEYVRVPFADRAMHLVPSTSSEEMLDGYCMMSDVLPTALETGLMDGNAKSGENVVVVGAGPIGLAVVMCLTTFYKPNRVFCVDLNPHRLEIAKQIGATDVIINKDGDAAQQIMDLTDGVGADLVVECIGVPAGWETSEDCVRAGGRIAILGVHGKKVTINLDRMWYRNFSMSAGLVNCKTTPMFMEKYQKGEIDPTKLISHRMKLSEMETAYDMFTNAAEHKALKIVMTNDISE